QVLGHACPVFRGHGLHLVRHAPFSNGSTGFIPVDRQVAGMPGFPFGQDLTPLRRMRVTVSSRLGSARRTIHGRPMAVQGSHRTPTTGVGMEYTHLGRSGLSVSRLWLGTMNFGPETDERDAHRIMDAAHDHGINVFDTANTYGWRKGEGWTEQIIGR